MSIETDTREPPASETPAGARTLLAVIPAHDEGPRIANVVAAASRYLPVLVVDDGSADDTAAQAAAAGAEVLRQQPNRGKGAALRVGFRRALDEGVDAVLTLDADGQHDPTDIPAFLAALDAATDIERVDALELVIGRRNFREMPPVRRLANELGRRAFSWAVGRDIPDNQSGYRLIGRRLMTDMLDSRESGFEFEVEMITTAVRRRYRIGWVWIRTIYGAPSHIRPIHHLAHFLRATRMARRSTRDVR